MIMKPFRSCIVAALGLLAANVALADCAADATVADTKRAHVRGQQLEKSGDAQGALAAYVAAQEYTCDPNPVAADAARRAAVVAKPLGDAAKSRGDHAAAFDFYERGGHFAAADRELISRINATPDDASLYGEALRHVQYRALPAFQSNEAVRIGVTGAYRLDPGLAKAVEGMPEKAAERALAAETAAFDEAWFAGYVALIRDRPENPSDIAALQQHAARMQAFHAGQRRDPLHDSLQAIGRIRNWETQALDGSVARTLERLRVDRAEVRAAVLTSRFAEAPKLLELAIDYLGQAGDSVSREPRVLKVRRQAEGLGDAAAARKRYQLAIEYYDVARAEAKAERSRVQLQALAQQQMQPTIAAMQRDAEALRAQFSDPQKIAEMKRQALEAQRSLQSGAQQRKSQAPRKSNDDLAAELGM
jgi:hypothetical protein